MASRSSVYRRRVQLVCASLLKPTSGIMVILQPATFLRTTEKVHSKNNSLEEGEYSPGLELEISVKGLTFTYFILHREVLCVDSAVVSCAVEVAGRVCRGLGDHSSRLVGRLDHHQGGQRGHEVVLEAESGKTRTMYSKGLPLFEV